LKKGINLWCFPNDWSLKKRLALAKDAGFHGIELNIEEEGYLKLESSANELNEIRNLVNYYQLDIVGLSTSLFWKYSLTANDFDSRQKALGIVKKMIEISSTLQVDTILVVPGLVTEDVRYDYAYERAMQSLKETAKFAEKKNVTIAIENVWNKFLLSPLEMKRFIEEIDSSFVKAYFDVGNILSVGFPDQWISILGSHIQKIHVKDYKNETGNFHGFTSLFQGDINWTQVMNALQAINYNGYITAEVMPYKFYSERLIFELSNSIDAMINGGVR
jgi:L-ribulose-5-phosphate 3-epimerase